MHLSLKSVIQQGKPIHFNHLCGQFHNFENMVDATNLEGGKEQKHLMHNVSSYMTPKLILQSIV